jgi:hypothetical protein
MTALRVTGGVGLKNLTAWTPLPTGDHYPYRQPTIQESEMIPTIETIVEDLLEGKITKQQAFAWLHQHAESAGRDLRDDFAACALQGIEASQGNGGNFISTVEKVAARAYELADEMLKARQP